MQFGDSNLGQGRCLGTTRRCEAYLASLAIAQIAFTIDIDQMVSTSLRGVTKSYVIETQNFASVSLAVFIQNFLILFTLGRTTT